ncbi:DNA primase TraC [Phycisphaerae bacterium RAS2]|nr:DNA primase TraC [Phycisphaerae bacterium RAS2]
MQFDIYQNVTDQIIAMLEKGVVPWRSPILGRQSAGMPKNLESGKEYRGVNVFLLAFTAWANGYESTYWLTFNQAKQKKGSVKNGEKSSFVIFWKQYETNDKETGEPTNVPVLRYYRVFNVAQCEGIAAPDAATFTPTDFQPIDAAEAIVKAYADAPTIEHGGTRAFYRPSTDSVRLPEPNRFASCEEYYSTLFHELAHSTGHSKRLDRKLDTEPQPFGSPDYGREELVAEMAAAFLSAHAGIKPVTIENQAAYLQGWLKQLRGDKKLVIAAAGAAQKASDWIRGERKPVE